MARSNWILPRADAACGRTFHPDRQTAEGHRIALEFWDQATGRRREGSRLVASRCKRCGGYHLVRRRAEDRLTPATPHHGPVGLDSDPMHPDLGEGELEASLAAGPWRSTWS